MSLQRIRLKAVFLLVVLLLLLASAIFGVLTYWLGGEPRTQVGPREEEGAFSRWACQVASGPGVVRANRMPRN